jgi:hypothetical protein
MVNNQLEKPDFLREGMLMKKLALLLLLLFLSSCFPRAPRDPSEVWTGTLSAKTDSFPELAGDFNCKLTQEGSSISGKCELIASVFGISSNTAYLLAGNLNDGESKLQITSAKDPNQPVDIVGIYGNNKFTGTGSLTIPFGANKVTTTYAITIRRQVPVAPVRDTAYDASGRWNLNMDLTDNSGGKLSIFGSCSISDNGGSLRASCDLSDSFNRISPAFTGKRTAVQAQLSYTSYAQDLEISFSGNFTDSRNFSGRGYLRDLKNSYRGTVSMNR